MHPAVGSARHALSRPWPRSGDGRAGRGPSSDAARDGPAARTTPSTTPGCPGSPNTGVPSNTPKANGLAGWMAICIHDMSAKRSSTTFTRSKSPMLTPPLSHEGVAAGGPVAQDLRRARPRRRPRAEVDRLAPGSADQGHQHRPVGLADLTWFERCRARRPARRRWRAPRPRNGGTTRRVRCPRLASTPRCAGTEHGAGAEHLCPGGDVATHSPDVAAGLDRLAQVDPFVYAGPAVDRCAPLDHHDGVGPRRHRRAGHDAHRLARPRP